MNLIDKILYCIEQDDTTRNESSELLKTQYEKSNDHDKLIINQFFISMCGYELKSIINNKTIFKGKYQA